MSFTTLPYNWLGDFSEKDLKLNFVGKDGGRPFMNITMMEGGDKLEAEYDMKPELLVMKSGDAKTSICFENSETVRMKVVNSKLVKWTEFWFIYRDEDNNGIPQINYSNDSFDNATVFDHDLMPIEAPAVCAYLVIQMNALAKVAEMLDKPQEAESWSNKADELLQKTIERSWNVEKFVFKKSGTEEYIEESKSILAYLPLLLDEQLPEEIRNIIIASLKTEGLNTEWGLLNEARSSRVFSETYGC
jgi:hypothetical protein